VADVTPSCGVVRNKITQREEEIYVNSLTMHAPALLSWTATIQRLRRGLYAEKIVRLGLFAAGEQLQRWQGQQFAEHHSRCAPDALVLNLIERNLHGSSPQLPRFTPLIKGIEQV